MKEFEVDLGGGQAQCLVCPEGAWLSECNATQHTETMKHKLAAATSNSVAARQLGPSTIQDSSSLPEYHRRIFSLPMLHPAEGHSFLPNASHNETTETSPLPHTDDLFHIDPLALGISFTAGSTESRLEADVARILDEAIASATLSGSFFSHGNVEQPLCNNMFGNIHGETSESDESDDEGMLGRPRWSYSHVPHAFLCSHK